MSTEVTEPPPAGCGLLASRTDPLTKVSTVPVAKELLSVRAGMRAAGQPWVIDFRTVPPWRNAGATQSGKFSPYSLRCFQGGSSCRGCSAQPR
jgi:S-DNA-T family DNA segregation ATPase FtsK/SpoIIIE